MEMIDMGFSTERDFEVALDYPTGTRMEKKIKRMLIAEGLGILRAARDEPQMVTIDDGPVDPANPDGPCNTHEIVAPNPIWKQYGFASLEDSNAMLARFEAVVI